MLRYFVLYKPYGILSQFTDKMGSKTLKDVYSFPAHVYPVGRLDKDSEGLLLLTNDKRLNQTLLHPKNRHSRTYWVQVEGNIDEQAIWSLSQGVCIRNKGRLYKTKKSTCVRMDIPPILPERVPPIRFRRHIPTSWIALSLIEGKNRQVRKMTATVGFPTLRLVRYSIGHLSIDTMQVGEVQEIERTELMQLMK